MRAYLFPGQGSQIKGMGKGLFNKFNKVTQIADDILGFPIEQLCCADPLQLLNNTQYTQPAIYIVSALHYYEKLEQGVYPDYVAGHSLGEYNALHASGVFDFATGLKLVMERGKLMANVKDGAMAAILGLTELEIKKKLQENELHKVTIANYNTMTQFVISGQQTDIVIAQKVLTQQLNTFVIPLRVSGAFHSPYMQSVQHQFATYLENFEFSPPGIPIISNYSAKPYSHLNIKFNIVQQISSAVRWVDSMQYLMSQGVTEFEELGVGNTLSNIVKEIKNKQ